MGGSMPEPHGLFRRKPISEPDSDLLDALNVSDACGQVRSEQPAIGSLVGEAAHCAEAEIDRTVCQLSKFQVDTIPENDALAERKPRLRAIPIVKLVNGVPVSSLSIRRTKAVQNR